MDFFVILSLTLKCLFSNMVLFYFLYVSLLQLVDLATTKVGGISMRNLLLLNQNERINWFTDDIPKQLKKKATTMILPEVIYPYGGKLRQIIIICTVQDSIEGQNLTVVKQDMEEALVQLEIMFDYKANLLAEEINETIVTTLSFRHQWYKKRWNPVSISL